MRKYRVIDMKRAGEALQIAAKQANVLYEQEGPSEKYWELAAIRDEKKEKYLKIKEYVYGSGQMNSRKGRKSARATNRFT